MGKKWEFFSSSAPEENDKKIENKKAPNKFLNWVSSLLKKKKEEPLSLNLSESDKVRETLKQEIASLPEDERVETETFLAEEVEKIEKKREGNNPELGDEVSFKRAREWYISDVKNGGELFEIRRSRKDPKGREVLEKEIARRDELSSPQEVIEKEAVEIPEEKVEEFHSPESFANKFKPQEVVIFSGESGWKVLSTAGNQVEIGKVKKDVLGRDIYDRRIVSDADLVGESEKADSGFKVGELVSIKGEDGWEVVSIAGASGKYLEVGKVRADKKGTLIFERKLVESKEVERKM